MATAELYYYTVVILGIGLSIKALETIALLREYAPGGIFDYAIAGNDRMLTSRASGFLAKLYSKHGMALLASASLVSFLVFLLSEVGSPSFTTALVVLIASNVTLYYRQAFGLDGADQMSFLILLSAFFCFVLPTDERLRQIGLWFIALQLALSYLVSGIAKLMSEEWRGGVAISGILSTYTYGTRGTRQLFRTKPRLSVMVCWMTIITEIALPFGLLLGPEGALLALTVGLLLHLSIAVVMGLNDFVWGFVAAYPSYYYVATAL